VTELSRRMLFWAPRGLSVAFIAFLSLFALDVFGEVQGFWNTLLALAIHLIPTFVLSVVLVLAWRWEWIGATLYAAAGVFYIVTVIPRRHWAASMKLVSILAIAGPALVIAALFLVNWLKRGELRATR